MLWGGIRADGELVLEPAFAYEGRVSRPRTPGDYRVRGLDGEGETLFSIRFMPGEISDGSRGFSYSIPFDAAWTEALDRLELSGPEGVTTVDREAGARAMMVIDRATGQVRSILRNAAAGLPEPNSRPTVPASGSSAGCRAPRADREVYGVGAGVNLSRAGQRPRRVRPASRPGSSVGRATDF